MKLIKVNKLLDTNPPKVEFNCSNEENRHFEYFI